MRLDVDEDNNVAYLMFGQTRGSWMQIPVAFPDQGEIVIDIDRDGKILGIEFINAHGLLPAEEIKRDA